MKDKEKKVLLNNNQSTIQCEICQQKFNSEVKLRVHIKLDHITSNSSQTDAPMEEVKVFAKYPCFYCDRSIAGLCQMKKHVLECHGLHKTDLPAVSSTKTPAIQPNLKFPAPVFNLQIPSKYLSFPVGFPSSLTGPQMLDFPNRTFGLTSLKCEHCEWIVNSEVELMNHKKIRLKMRF